MLLPEAVWKMVEGAQEAVVIPDGALTQLPFEALVIAPSSNWADAKLWLDLGPTVRYAASATSLASVIARSGGHPIGPPSVLSVSDPIFDPEEVARAQVAAGASAEPTAARTGTTGDRSEPAGARVESRAQERSRETRPVDIDGKDPKSGLLRGRKRLARLPGTARESAAVVEAFKDAGFKDAVVLLTRAQATEPAVRQALEGKRFLHLATHGIVEPGRSDLLAGLALTAPAQVAASTAEDGMLQLFEIQEKKLDADLVVLSACDTNVGRRIAGEGVFSLARGFFAAGARRVVASLWPVDDDSSASLVGDLFRAIAAAEAAGRQARPADALRDAKRKLRRRAATAAPFFWAAFTCSGIR